MTNINVKTKVVVIKEGCGCDGWLW